MIVSKIDSQITLEYLQNQCENQYFERKGLGDKNIKPTKIAEELIGMLNAGGGVLVFGVSDSGEIQDLNSLDEDLNRYQTLIFDFIAPYSSIRIEDVMIDGKLIFLYHVQQNIEHMFKRKDNESIFLRVGDTNRLLDREAVRMLEYDKTLRQFEEEVNDAFDFTDLDTALLERYRERLNYDGTPLDLLTKRYLAIKKNDTYLMKNAGILIFAKDPEKYIPSASLRYIRYEGDEVKTGTEHNVVKDERFEDNIPRIIGKVKAFLNASLKDYHFLDIKEGIFKKVPEYPEGAWLEGIVNALCHRSYNVQGSSIYIKHFDNRIEISNSGPLPAQVNVDNIREVRYARNPRIARVLEDMGFVRQLNEGVKRIYESMEKSMLSTPEYNEDRSNVYLTLRNKIREHSKTIPDVILTSIQKDWKSYNETQRKILEYLFNSQQATIDTLSEICDVSEKTVRRNLVLFIEQNIVDRLSDKARDKNALYTLKKL